MLELSHHVSETHPQMPIRERAAQFAPFRALTGHEQAIRESARLTDPQAELDEERINILNAEMQLLQEHLDEQPEITVTWFQPDAKKEGGAYKTISGVLKKINLAEGFLILRDGERIPVQKIVSLESNLFAALLNW